MSSKHLDAIRSDLTTLYELVESDETMECTAFVAVDRAIRHAEALAAQVERLQAWGVAVEGLARYQEQFNPNRNYSDFSIGEFRRDHLQPGDLPEREVTT